MAEHTLLASRITAGLLAGLFFAFAVAIMPALRGVEDAQFENTMNRINGAIVNPAFLVVFLGAPALAIAAALVVKTPIGYVAAALCVATLLITITGNIPLNNQLAEGTGRALFENRWTLWNAVRTATSVGGFACLLIA